MREEEGGAEAGRAESKEKRKEDKRIGVNKNRKE